jgi:hypothetical protein
MQTDPSLVLDAEDRGEYSTSSPGSVPQSSSVSAALASEEDDEANGRAENPLQQESQQQEM